MSKLVVAKFHLSGVFCASLALLFISVTAAVAGLGSKATMYVGGTVTSIRQLTEGTSSTNDEKVFVFTYKGGALSIPYDQVNVLEYGQKAGRRLGLAIVLSPIALLSKKRKHFLTINYVDTDQKQQAAVFEVGKDVVRVTLAALEARTGKKIDYQDEEARKSGRGN
jgi:predicted TIM-barrel enzyme